VPFSKIAFRPGINRDITQYSNEGGWYDSDKVRFRNGFPEKIGGWQRFTQNTFLGNSRKMHEWYDLESERFLGIGTNIKLYVNRGGEYIDITPIRATTNPMVNDPFETVAIGSPELIVEDTAHGAVAGSYVTFSGATGPISGIPASEINAEHEITSIIDGNHYTISVTTNAAAAGVAGGGAAVIAEYQLNISTDTGVGGNGWGVGYWGGPDGWGESSGLATTESIRLWSLDDFGEDLIACPRGGAIYLWDRSAGLTSRAEDISTLGGAEPPTVANYVMTSDLDRRVFAFGTNPIGSGDIDPMLIRWSSEEDIGDWDPTPVNSAGELRVSNGSEIICAVRTKQENVVFTDVGLWSLQYVGGNDVYGLQIISNSNTTILSQNAAAYTGSAVAWMGNGSFYLYDGQVKTLPCTVQRYVFDNLNITQKSKIFAGINTGYNEVWWFYPSADSSEIDRYVIWDYVANTWSIGTMERTSWLMSGDESKPIATADGRIYVHEVGYDADGSALTAYVESADFDIGDGQSIMFCRRLIPDVDFSGNTMSTLGVSIKTRDWPGSSKVVDWSGSITNTTTQLWPRARGRQSSIRFESTDENIGWRLGSQRLDLVADGMR
jgi:hypothetical protein